MPYRNTLVELHAIDSIGIQKYKWDLDRRLDAHFRVLKRNWTIDGCMHLDSHLYQISRGNLNTCKLHVDGVYNNKKVRVAGLSVRAWWNLFFLVVVLRAFCLLLEGKRAVCLVFVAGVVAFFFFFGQFSTYVQWKCHVHMEHLRAAIHLDMLPIFMLDGITYWMNKCKVIIWIILRETLL